MSNTLLVLGTALLLFIAFACVTIKPSVTTSLSASSLFSTPRNNKATQTDKQTFRISGI